MFDDKPWLVPALGAGFLGLLIGLAAQSTGNEAAKRTKASITSIEENLAGVSESQALLSEQNGVLGEGQAALDTKLAELGSLAAQLDVKVSEMNARLDAIEDLGEQVSETTLTRDGFMSAMDEMHSKRHGAAATAAATAETPATDTASDETAAATGDESTATETAETETAAGSAEMSLGVGQTALVGEGRFFVQRVTDDTVSGQIIGGDKIELTAWSGPVALGGCSLSLTGIADGKAMLQSEC